MRYPRFSRAVICTSAFLFSIQLSVAAEPERDWSFNFGGGYSAPVGGLNSVLTDGWNFTVGTGYNVSDKLGFNLEYMSQYLGIESPVLDDFSNKINGPTDGSTHVWSVTLSPIWHFELGRRVGAYLIGGGGYYHVNAQVTTPGVALVPGYCDPYWGCWGGGLVGVDRIIAEHKDDTGGINFGGGISFDMGDWGSQFYVESRYHYVLTHGADLQLLPLTIGFRW